MSPTNTFRPVTSWFPLLFGLEMAVSTITCQSTYDKVSTMEKGVFPFFPPSTIINTFKVSTDVVNWSRGPNNEQSDNYPNGLVLSVKKRGRTLDERHIKYVPKTVLNC